MSLNDELLRIKAEIFHLGTKMNELTAMVAALKPEPAPVMANHILLTRLDTAFQHIKSERKIEAIREVRCLTGCGLKEAKDLVEILSEYIYELKHKDD